MACQDTSDEPIPLPISALTADVLASDKDFRDYTFLHNKITGQSAFLKKGTAQDRVNAVKEMQEVRAIYSREKSTGSISLDIQQRAAKSFGFSSAEDLNAAFKSLIEIQNRLVQKFPSLKQDNSDSRSLLSEAYAQLGKELPYVVVFGKRNGYFALNKGEWRRNLGGLITLRTGCCPDPWDSDCNGDGIPECGVRGCPPNCCDVAMNKLQKKYRRCDVEFFSASFFCLVASLAMVAECPPCAIFFAIDCELVAGMIYGACLDDATAEYFYDIVACGECPSIF